MQFSPNVTKRKRRRKLPSGVVVHHTRYVVNFKDPKTHRRRQQFFERRCQRKPA